MIQKIYMIILAYFILGGIAFYFINRNKEREVARKNRIKYITYFFIINILFFSIVINPLAFQYLSILIISFGFYELIKVYIDSGVSNKKFFLVSILIFGIFSAGFFLLGKQKKEFILYTFLILSIFDSFSQITGQLWGHKKLLPRVSPNKTVGGMIGGALTALAGSLLLQVLFPAPLFRRLLFTTGILFFAFAGDIAASFYKRQYGVKDYSTLIPGHGGFLDRFDSLIAVGIWVELFAMISQN